MSFKPAFSVSSFTFIKRLLSSSLLFAVRVASSAYLKQNTGKNTGVDCHALLQGIFPTQGSNPPLLHLPYRQAGSLPLEPLGKPTCSVTLASNAPSLTPRCPSGPSSHITSSGELSPFHSALTPQPLPEEHTSPSVLLVGDLSSLLCGRGRCLASLRSPEPSTGRGTKQVLKYLLNESVWASGGG